MRKTEYASEGSKTHGSASEETRSLSSGEGSGFAVYRNDPAGFARDVLGSTWWDAQTEIAGLLATHRRVAVKAANGVGKTFLAADILLWFLYSHVPSVVLTTAPTWRQVEYHFPRGKWRTRGGKVSAKRTSSCKVSCGCSFRLASVLLF